MWEEKLFWNNPGFKSQPVKTFIPNWSYIWNTYTYLWIPCIFWSESAMSSSAITYIFLQMDIQIFWIKMSFITAWTLEAFIWIFKAPYQMCWYLIIHFLTESTSFTILQFVENIYIHQYFAFFDRSLPWALLPGHIFFFKWSFKFFECK